MSITGERLLVIFSDDFPIDLLSGDIIMFPLDDKVVRRPAIQCRSVIQAPGGMLELVPQSETQLHVRGGSLWIHEHHVLAVLRLPAGSPIGFVQG